MYSGKGPLNLVLLKFLLFNYLNKNILRINKN